MKRPQTLADRTAAAKTASSHINRFIVDRPTPLYAARAPLFIDRCSICTKKHKPIPTKTGSLFIAQIAQEIYFTQVMQKTLAAHKVLIYYKE